MRKLTDRQVAVLAAIERTGNPTALGLGYEFRTTAAKIYRVIETLIRRGLVEQTGNPHWVYLGGPEDWGPSIHWPPGMEIPAEDIVRFRVIT